VTLDSVAAGAGSHGAPAALFRILLPAPQLHRSKYRMTQEAPRRWRMALAWVVCAVSSLCGVAFAVLIWWVLPSSLKPPIRNHLLRWVFESLVVFGFLALAGLGLIVGVLLCRRFLSPPEFVKLTTEVSDAVRDT
jgi:hypothetical protein